MLFYSHEGCRELTDAVATCIQSSQNSSTDGGNDLQAPLQTEEPLAVDNC